MRKVLIAAFAAMAVAGPATATGGLSDPPAKPSVEQVKEFMMAQRRSCSAASTCQEAVEMWCGGYSGAEVTGTVSHVKVSVVRSLRSIGSSERSAADFGSACFCKTIILQDLRPRVSGDLSCLILQA